MHWEHILQNKYNHLLTTQVAILVAYPLLQHLEVKFPAISLLLLAAITPALWVGLSKKIFMPVMSIGVVAYLFHFSFHMAKIELADDSIRLLLVLYAVFYFLAIVILIKRISSYSIVTSDTIKGGISIYILLGFFWAILYMIILTFDVNALTNVGKQTVGFDCYYYSFATLTTLGYGDITPVAKYARILAILESVAGPIYLAIFGAQIIGLNIAQKMKR